MNAASARRIVPTLSTMFGALLCVASFGAIADGDDHGRGRPVPSGTPDFTVPFDAGMACQFPLTVEGWGNKTHTREFTDKQGNQRIDSEGLGNDFRFTNAANGKVTTQRAQGFEQRVVVYPDGSQKLTTNGALLLIMFPTDILAGPTTTYYNGHTELFIAADGVGTLSPPRGHARDICAELS